MIGERLLRARQAAGLSLRDLAEQANLSYADINKFEIGKLTPSSAQLYQLARILQVRSEYFFRPTTIPIDSIKYRKRANAPKKLVNRIHADAIEQSERWMELLALFPHSPIQPFSLPNNLPAIITTQIDIELLADQLRNAWQLGCSPIPSLINAMEAHGIIIVITNVGYDEKFDGLAGTMEQYPLVVISQNWPGDRQRFTLAHELGHILLKQRLSENLKEEATCHKFAGALLLPKSALLANLGQQRHHLEPRELLLLKQDFGLSMAAVLHRARDCEIISQDLYTSIIKDFSKRGWRRKEPGTPYPHEETKRFEQLVYYALAEEYLGQSKAAELLGISVSTFRRQQMLIVTDAHTN